MRGYTHALSGAAAWLAVSSASEFATGVYAPGSTVAIAGSMLCAGAALVPDTDHTEGTVAWSLPPVKFFGTFTIVPSPTRGICQAVNWVSGGHRHGTHSLIGVLAFTFLAWVATLWKIDVAGKPVAIGCTVLAVFLIAFAAKALGVARSFGTNSKSRQGVLESIFVGFMHSFLGPWLIALAAAGVATWYLEWDWAWLPLAMAIGVTLHVAGDGLTTQGVPLLWPFNPAPPKALLSVPFFKAVWRNNGYFAIPVLGDTTSKREAVFAVLLGCYMFYLIAYEVTTANGGSVLL